MTNFTSRFRSVLLFVCLSVCGSAISQAQTNEAQKIEDRLSDPVYMAWLSEPAVSLCVECHLEGPGFGAIVSGSSGKLTEFSRREEMEVWISQDKHTIARRRVEPLRPEQQEEDLGNLFDSLLARANKVADVLTRKGITINRGEIGLREVPQEWVGDSNLLSRRICDKLWGQDHVDTPEGYTLFHDACLTCHGGVTPGKQPDRPDTVMTKNMIGIDCLYCHQTGDETKWQKDHYDGDEWRLATPQFKSSQGMADLANTGNQASLCLDCHVGNRQKNMFVTHEMYAAGHPPLPSVEVETFCQQMPQHWQTPGQLHERLKGYENRDEYFETNYPGVVGGITDAGKTYWSTRKLLIGALTARHKQVQTYLDSIQQDQWADYSLFDCAACHHELQTDSRRQERYVVTPGFQTPGRPRQHEWHRPLTEIAYQLAGRDAFNRINQLESQLADCLDRHPFGKPAEVQAASQALLKMLDEAITAAQSRPFDATLVRQVLKVLCQKSTTDLLTYDSARQVAWAIRVIGSELESEGEAISATALNTLKEFQQADVAGLELKLPAGRKQFIYPKSLGEDFQRRESFEPDELIRRLRSISASL